MSHPRPREREGPKPPGGYGRGTEIALTPVVFVGLGWLLDRWLGTEPLFLVVLAVLGISGTFVKIWFGYDREMRAVEAGKPWTRAPGSEGRADGGPIDGPALGDAS